MVLIYKHGLSIGHFFVDCAVFSYYTHGHRLDLQSAIIIKYLHPQVLLNIFFCLSENWVDRCTLRAFNSLCFGCYNQNFGIIPPTQREPFTITSFEFAQQAMTSNLNAGLPLKIEMPMLVSVRTYAYYVNRVDKMFFGFKHFCELWWLKKKWRIEIFLSQIHPAMS